eukprot:3306084-Rhodomonas_salina.2
MRGRRTGGQARQRGSPKSTTTILSKTSTTHNNNDDDNDDDNNNSWARTDGHRTCSTPLSSHAASIPCIKIPGYNSTAAESTKAVITANISEIEQFVSIHGTSLTEMAHPVRWSREPEWGHGIWSRARTHSHGAGSLDVDAGVELWLYLNKTRRTHERAYRIT